MTPHCGCTINIRQSLCNKLGGISPFFTASTTFATFTRGWKVECCPRCLITMFTLALCHQKQMINVLKVRPLRSEYVKYHFEVWDTHSVERKPNVSRTPWPRFACVCVCVCVCVSICVQRASVSWCITHISGALHIVSSATADDMQNMCQVHVIEQAPHSWCMPGFKSWHLQCQLGMAFWPHQDANNVRDKE
jgi:hypothetical protein